MDPVRRDTTPNEVYVKRYKDFVRLLRISKMLSTAKIIIHFDQNSPMLKLNTLSYQPDVEELEKIKLKNKS